MALEITLVVVGAAAILLGLIGCVVPIVPGPLVGLAGLLLLLVAGGTEVLPLWLIAVAAVLAIGGTLSDQVLPAAASNRAGAGRPGVVGSVIGMLVGMIFFPPFGLIVGAFAGALLGEVLFHRDNTHPIRSAFAVLRGTLAATLVKLVVTGVIAIAFVERATQLLAS